jgi:hypothetical protein
MKTTSKNPMSLPCGLLGLAGAITETDTKTTIRDVLDIFAAAHARQRCTHQ